MVETISVGLQILYIVLAIIWLTIWVITIIHQAKKRKFWWLGITALIQITLIIYWIVFAVNPKFREKKNFE